MRNPVVLCRVLLGAALLLSMIACTEDESPSDAEETQRLLTENSWSFADMRVVVENPEARLPLPILAGATISADAVQSFDLQELLAGFSPGERPTPEGKRVQFQTDGQILEEDESGELVFMGSQYSIQDESRMRLMIQYGYYFSYDYVYSDEDETFVVSATDTGAMRLLEALDQALKNIIVSGIPHDLADKLAEKLLTNEDVSNAIGQFLVDGLAGKIDELLATAPDALAARLSSEIVDLLQQADLETFVADLLAQKLADVTDFDPDQVAGELAAAIAEAISQELTADRIAEFLLPYLDTLAAADPAVASAVIANAIVDLLDQFLTEERLFLIIEALYTQFTELDDAAIGDAADRLATVVEENWINETNLSARLLPFTTLIDSTPVFQLSALAADMVADLQALVAEIEARFPGVEPTPDWDTIETAIHGVLIAAKPIIGSQGPDVVADNIANLLFTEFLHHQFFVDTFTSALQALQMLPPAQVADAIASWLVSLEDLGVGQAIVDAIEAALLPLLEGLDPTQAAWDIAMKIRAFLEPRLTGDTAYAVLFPILEAVSNANTEAIAEALVGIIIDSGVIDPDVAEERIYEVLLPLFDGLGDLDGTTIAEALVEAIQNSGIVNAILDQERVARMIKYKLYDVIISVENTIASVQAIELLFVKE